MLDFGIMPPLMFGVMVLFMLIGFPVAFSLATVGLFFGILGTHTGHFGAASCRHCRFVSTESFPTTFCFRSPSSPPWAPFSKGAASLKICWRERDSYSEKFPADWLTR